MLKDTGIVNVTDILKASTIFSIDAQNIILIKIVIEVVIGVILG